LAKKKGGQKLPPLLVLLMDFVSRILIALELFCIEPSTATLLAVIIGLQNLPEAFNS